MLNLVASDLKGVPVLVVGADGYIGRELSSELLRLGAKVYETTRRSDMFGECRLFLDLAAPAETWKLPDGIKISFICAGVTSLLTCEQNPEETSRINVDNTLLLMHRLLNAGSQVVYMSTGLVLGGMEPFVSAQAPYLPICEYARQKVEVERALLGWNRDGMILRMTKVLSPRIPIFNDWLGKLRRGEVVHPFSDLVMAPISLGYLVDALLRIAGSGSHGIFQVTGNKDVSYAETASFMAKCLGVSETLVQPVISREAGTHLVAIPKHTTLDNERMQTEFGIESADVWGSIRKVFSI